MFKTITGLFILLSFLSCQKNTANKQEIWIYTSLYKDTIADIKPKLEHSFPGVEFNFYQAGSEEVAAKINAELMAGAIKADILISSDRFWYEDMANNGKLYSYEPQNTTSIPATFKHPEHFYTTLSHPVMVMAYNSDVVKTPPMTFKEMTDKKWKGQFSTGSPLASGTNFTTLAFLQDAYGPEYLKGLRANEVISEGGNSAVIRRLQSGERPVGAVLLENLLRVVNEDKRIKIIYPNDGAIIQANVLAIVKKEESRELAQKVADWMFGKDGQEAMVRSYMYSPLDDFAPPTGALPLKEIFAKARPWSKALLDKVTQNRESIKEDFTKVMFQ